MKPRHPSETAAGAETVDARSPISTREPADPSRLVAGRYEILGLVGSGGMGTVYRARDRELEETVALKMLKKRLASSEQALARFRREVKLARRVTHRNVARTFDIGEHAGGKFLTMEFIDGEMLRAVLGRSRHLPIPEAVRIAREVSTGLAAAHAAGVLHRDLKPENVIVERSSDPNERRAVITDFGIARALTQGDATKSAGDVVGTPAYMAPEQLENSTLDERTDVYALGVMLFELLTGVVPWGTENPIKAALARLREGPPDPRTLRPSIPAELAELVVRCMARDPKARFASAAEVAEGLARVGASPAPAASSSASAVGSLPPISSAVALAPTPRAARATVAVLPLVHQGDPAVGYVAESITDDLVELLESVPEILVVHAPQASLDPRAAGRALGVHAVVTGTFRHAAARLDVALSLVTVEDGFEIWSQHFERLAADVATIADDAARGIADALSTRLTAAAGASRGLPTDPVAYDLFLRGRSVFMRGWYDASGEAIRLLGEAYARSPDNAIFAAAHARALARAYGVDNAGGDAHAAQRAAERALALDPGRAEARVALAMVNLYRGDAVGAASELARALTVAPTDPDVLELVGRLRVEVGPLPIAIGQLELVLAREPTFAEARYSLARARALEGFWEDVDALLASGPIDVSQRIPLLLNRGRLLVWRRDRNRSAAFLDEVEQLIPKLPERYLAMLAAAVRGPLSADDRLRLAVLFPTGASTPQRRAAFNAQVRTEVLIASNDPDAALESLREADANGLLDLEWLDHCPLFESIRTTPSFEAVRRATGLRAARVRDVLDRS